MTTLHLWVENQPGDSDETTNYIEATDWQPPAGVQFHEQTLSGTDPEAVFAAFLDLARAVAEVGHGQDMQDEEMPAPRLTACPLEESKYTDGAPNYTTATENLRRLTCDEFTTFAEWVR